MTQQITLADIVTDAGAQIRATMSETIRFLRAATKNG